MPVSSWANKELRSVLLAWPLFFLICLGLGYPALKRYDPRAADGLSDAALYYQLVVSGPKSVDRTYMRSRILIPLVAKPFSRFARSHLKGREPIFFGLLVANALFCATAACFLIDIGYRITADRGVAFLGGALYLLNFAIPNLQLAGLIDSGEACFMLAITWSLLTGRWFWLPLWGVLGALAKETFVPFAFVFMTVWWIIERRSERRMRSAWIVATVIASIAALIILQSFIAGHLVWPWEMTAQSTAKVNLLAALWRGISNHALWYVFGWLLPFGLWRLGQLPRSWVMASAITALIALLLASWQDISENAARPLFDAVGPVLCLSVALLLVSGHTVRKTISSGAQPSELA